MSRQAKVWRLFLLPPSMGVVTQLAPDTEPAQITEVLIKRNKRIPVEERLPVPFQPVVVVCVTFNCLGYVDGKSVWHYATNAEIKDDVISWEQYP
jgi:hypothetical protein